MPRLSIAALLVVLALLAVGCSGGDDAAPTPTTADPAATTAGPLDDISDVADLSELSSFRWDIRLRGADALLAQAGVPVAPDGSSEFVATGSYIAPDQAQVVINAGGIEYKQTVIGDEQWTTIAGVLAGPEPATSSAQDLIYVSAFVNPDAAIGDTSMECGVAESVNGMDAVRCETADAFNSQVVTNIAGSETEVSNASFTLWISVDGNQIVRWEFAAAGIEGGSPFELSAEGNITDINSVPAIEP